MVSLSKHLSPETMFCVSSNYTSCRRQLDQPQAGQSVSLLSIHHPPDFIFCVFYKYTSCCRQLNQPQAGWCLYCPYTIFQKLCSVSFLNTPSARLGYQGSVGVFTVHTPSSRNYIFFFFFFINTLAAAGSSTSHRLDGVFTVHTPSSRNYVLCLF